MMLGGGTSILLEKLTNGELAGAIGVGGANGTDLVCSIMRALPYLVPKVVVSAVACTAAVQWCVAESDICMYPSIGDSWCASAYSARCNGDGRRYSWRGCRGGRSDGHALRGPDRNPAIDVLDDPIEGVCLTE